MRFPPQAHWCPLVYLECVTTAHTKIHTHTLTPQWQYCFMIMWMNELHSTQKHDQRCTHSHTHIHTHTVKQGKSWGDKHNLGCYSMCQPKYFHCLHAPVCVCVWVCFESCLLTYADDETNAIPWGVLPSDAYLNTSQVSSSTSCSLVYM